MPLPESGEPPHQVAVTGRNLREVRVFQHDRVYGRMMMEIVKEQARVLREDSAMLCKCARETVAASRRARKRSADIAKSLDRSPDIEPAQVASTGRT